VEVAGIRMLASKLKPLCVQSSMFFASRSNIDMPLIIGQIAIIDVLYSCCCVRLAEKATALYRKTKASADSEKLR
jgi:hypothetical protein